VLVTVLGSVLGNPIPRGLSLVISERDPKGWSMVLITALGSVLGYRSPAAILHNQQPLLFPDGNIINNRNVFRCEYN
jgi:hypothetical protein